MSRRNSPSGLDQRHNVTDQSRHKYMHRRPLRFEPLEDRRLLAVVIVDTLDDSIDFNDGHTSLREAIFATNLVGGADTIEFAPALTASGAATILLTQGELRITDSLTIIGPGADLLTIDASGSDPTPELKNGDGSRILNIPAFVSLPAEVTVRNLTITGGDPSHFGGGAIYAPSTTTLVRLIGIVITDCAAFYGGGIYGNYLELINTTLVRNHAGSSGGAIIGGDMTIIDCTFISNTASHRGGAISYGGSAEVSGTAFIDNVAMRDDGGAIDAFGILTIHTSRFEGNSAGRDGGAVSVSGGLLEIADSEFASNSAYGRESTYQGEGGAILADAESIITGTSIVNNYARYHGGGIAGSKPLVISNSTISGNYAGNCGGGIYNRAAVQLTNCMVSRNLADDRGGAICARGGDITITSSDLIENKARLGGAVSSPRFGTPQIVIKNSTLSGNLATNRGGAIHGSYSTGRLMVERSTISENSAPYGGGIHFGGDVRLADSTVSGNSAANKGGGIFAFNSRGRAWQIQRSTIAENFAVFDGGGVYVSSGDLTLDYSIVVGNWVDAGSGPDVSGIISANRSLIGAGTNFLAPLAHNGGPTQTHALLPGSPAIDAGDPMAVAGMNGVPLHDQRGAPWSRVYGGGIDIGAVESQPNPLPGDYNFDGKVNVADFTVWRDTLGSTTDLSANGGDSNNVIDTADYAVWTANFGETFGSGASEEERGASEAIAAHVGEFLRNSRLSTLGHTGASPRDAVSEFRRNSPTWAQARSLALLDLLIAREDESEVDAGTAPQKSIEDAEREAAFVRWGEELFPDI